MSSLKTRALLVLGAAGLLAGIAPATSAFADPPGCTKQNWGINLLDGRTLDGHGHGSCWGHPAYRVFYYEIKQDLDFRPDPVALSSSDAGSKEDYYASVHGCDNGNTATYYGRVFFDGNTDYADTKHEKYHAC